MQRLSWYVLGLSDPLGGLGLGLGLGLCLRRRLEGGKKEMED